MPNNSDALIQVGVDIPKSVSAITDDLKKKVVPQVNEQKPLKVIGTLNLPDTQKKIQAQLSTIGKNLNVNLIVDTNGINNQMNNVSNVVKTTLGNSVNAANSGLADTESKLKKVEQAREALLKQLEILQTKTSKAGLNIGTFTDKDQISYLQKFKDLIGSMNYDNIKDAGHNLKMMKLEFQALNATASNDLPESAIEGINQKLKVMPSSILKIETSFSKLQNPTTELSNSVKELQTLMKSASNDFNDDGTVKTNEQKIESYNKLKNAVTVTKNEVSAMLQVEKAQGSVSPQTKYYAKIREETELIYNLKKKLVNADVEENAELNRQIKNAETRIKYDEKQLEKRGLISAELDREVNDMERVYQEELKIATARQSDKNSQVGIDVSTALTNLSTLEQKWEKEGILVGEFKDKVEALKTTFNGVTTSADFSKANKEMQNLSANAKKLETNLKQANQAATLKQDKTILSNRVSAYMSTNTKAAKKYREEFTRLNAEIKGIDNTEDLKRVKKEFQDLTLRIKAAGDNTKTFGDRLKEAATKFASWMSLTTAISYGVRSIREMVTNVIELDTAMVSLKKVTDETNQSYNNFLTKSYDNAKKLGMNVSDLVEQTAIWSKLGYSLEESTDSAQISSIYANVGEVDNVTAVSDIVTALKAFKNEGLEAIDVVDKLNNLSNRYAVSAADLGTGLSNSASALALAGNDIDQTLSMITSVTEIIQDASEAGNAVKILSLRLRGMKGELQALNEETDGIESISKIQTQILNLTGNKVNIFDDNGNFKSTYEIMNQISKVWNDMSQVDQSQLLELIAGKNRANAVSALLTNMSTAESALSDSATSAGSAMAEQEKWMEGIEAKLNTLNAVYEQISATIVNDDLLKTLIDDGTSVLNVLNDIISNVGLLPTLIGGVTTALAFKNVGELNMPVYAQSLLLCA